MGVWGRGLGLGFWGWGFQLMGVWGLGCGAFWVLWVWGSLYKHKRITLGKKWCGSWESLYVFFGISTISKIVPNQV